jgi:hypothetical protein
MFGFPPILDGNAGIKFTNNADSGFPKPGIREIFYSNRNGNWTDVGIWETASGRVGRTPTANDDVYVRHTITLVNASVNNLFITPTGTLNGNGSLSIFGNLQSYGIFNYNPNSTVGFNITTLFGTNNYIDKTKQTATYIVYARNGSQPIIDANYSILGLGIAFVVNEKYLTCDLTVGAFNCANVDQGGSRITWFNFKNFNFTCNGSFSTVNSNISFHVEGNQSLIFKGATAFTGGIYCQNSPTFEFQNGAAIGTGTNVPNWNTPYGTVNSYLGTGLIRFTTNSQTLSGGFVQLTLDNIIQIDDNITLTTTYTPSASLTLTNTINGLGANSRLRQGLNSTLNFGTATAATTAMSTGLFDFTTNANTIGYTGNYSATIPSYFTNFHSLTISGTGTKTLGVNTTLNGNLSLVASTSGAILELSTFNLSVTGTTTIGISSATVFSRLSKNGAGNVLFTGLVTVHNLGTLVTLIDFSVGNPTVELRGGIGSGNFNDANFIKTGTGQWTFSTNNQSIACQGALNFDCPVLVSGAITLTLVMTAGAKRINFNNSVNGNNAGSTLINTNNTILSINNASFPQPMTTGILDITTNANILCYAFNGNYTIPYTSLQSLQLESTSGTKSLSGNTILNGNLIMETNFAGSTFELSTFNLTVLGTTNLRGGTLSKNGAGNIIFTGTIDYRNSSASINFTGNPSVELKNGINFINPGTTQTGTGTWTFSTNSQSISNIAGNSVTLTFNCLILVSGTITLTIGGGNFTYTFVSNGLINGNNAGSTLRLGTNSPTLNYQNTTQPMATGVLDTSTNLNTFIYGAGNQQVRGGTPQQYRNLRFSGSGTTKTLQGNINVQNTYTVDAGVTVNLNGFTKTP